MPAAIGTPSALWTKAKERFCFPLRIVARDKGVQGRGRGAA